MVSTLSCCIVSGVEISGWAIEDKARRSKLSCNRSRQLINSSCSLPAVASS